MAGEVERKIAAGEMLTLFELLRCRVRYFCAGLAFGAEGFVKAIGMKRTTRCHAPHQIKCAELAGIGTACRVRREGAITVPEPPEE